MAGNSISGSGLTVWLTGLSGAGKSTIAAAVAAMLRGEGTAVEVLDGDEVRAVLSAGLGFSRANRDANVRRIGWVARLLARNGVVVLVPTIAPYAATRHEIRAAHADEGLPFLEIHVAAPLEVCARRDVKGLYARHARGEIRGLTGVDDPYEPPVAPELRVDSHAEPVADSVTAVVSAVRARRDRRSATEKAPQTRRDQPAERVTPSEQASAD